MYKLYYAILSYGVGPESSKICKINHLFKQSILLFTRVILILNEQREE